MTWFANEILAQATPELVAEVVAFPGYRDSSYLIRSLASHPFHCDEVRHGVPAAGLLVVQPVGEPEDVSTGGDSPVVPWLPPPGWPIASLELRGSAVSRVVPDLPDSALPPDDFLGALKALAARHRTTVAYAYFSTFGGSNELEYAWVFADREYVLVNTLPDQAQHLSITPGNEPARVAKGLIESLCPLLGFDLPTWFFAPHTRDFPWEEHRPTRLARRTGHGT
ncbi:MAG: hypothetical protein HOW73_22670 [Polyangiaceae bacterium]|nr:hypothetical protein [Polyangiaceae bacterium]